MAVINSTSWTMVRRFLMVSSFILGIGGSTVVALGSLHTARSPHEHIVVTGGSMEPTISVKEVITVDPQRTPTVGDVVTFFREGQLITHRVTRTWSGTDPSGRVRQMFTTHGDANDKPDPWTVLDDEILGTVVSTSSLVSFASWLSMRPALLAGFILPMLIGLFVEEVRRLRKWKLCPERDLNPQGVATRGV